MKLLELLSQISEVKAINTDYPGAWIKAPNTVINVRYHEELSNKLHLSREGMLRDGWVRVVGPGIQSSGLCLDGNLQDIKNTRHIWWKTAIKFFTLTIDYYDTVGKRYNLYKDGKEQLYKDLGLVSEAKTTINESMDFYAGVLKKEDDGFIYSNSVIGDEGSGMELNVSNANGYEIMQEIGYIMDDYSIDIPIDEFIATTTQWLQQHVGKRSAEIPVSVDKKPGRATMYDMGTREGYYNEKIMTMNKMAREGKRKGATHVWLA